MATDPQKRALEHARDDIGARETPGNAWVAAPESQSWGDRLKDYIIDRVVPEVGDMLAHKTAQGAAELSQALNSQSNAYVPYGAGQQGLDVYGPQQSYQDMLRDASQGAGQDQGQEMER